MERRKRDKARQWRQWTERDARALLDELAASQETAAQFARRKGVSQQRLAYWRKRLASATPAFVSVAMAARPSSARPQIDLLARGVTVRVHEDIDAEKLASIVEMLACGHARC